MPWLTKKSKERGQVAIEFILIVGAILVTIMYAFPFITRHAELNKGIAAARDGAQFGASMRGMGFYSSSTSESNKNPPGVLKIDRIEYDITENPDGVDNVSISIYVRGAPELNTQSIKTTIQRRADSHLYRALHGDYPPNQGISLPLSDTTGEYYAFDIKYPSWIDT